MPDARRAFDPRTGSISDLLLISGSMTFSQPRFAALEGAWRARIAPPDARWLWIGWARQVLIRKAPDYRELKPGMSGAVLSPDEPVLRIDVIGPIDPGRSNAGASRE